MLLEEANNPISTEGISDRNTVYSEADEDENGEAAALKKITSEILEVEEKLAQMSMEAVKQNTHEIKQMQEWKEMLGADFPLQEILEVDTKRANCTLGKETSVQVHNSSYFKHLVQYLKSLDVTKLLNYIGCQGLH
ncbi:uncharacterized protein LOC144103362 [Amblyomma americanum]